MDPIQQLAIRGAMEASLSRGKQKPGVEEAGKEFGELFEKLLGGANDMQVKAGDAVDGLLSGEVKDVHEVMVAMNKAELSFKFLVEVRNKLTDAYKELMNNVR